MNIYKDYDIEDILFDSPCNIDNINIYPVKVDKWKKFQKYIPYLIMSRQHYKLTDEQPFLPCIIVNMMVAYNNNKYPKDDNLKLELINYILRELCDMFSIITRTNILYKNDNILGDCFINNSKGIVISESNFDTIREIVLAQNIIFEPVIYESKLKEKWARSVARGRAKNNKSLSLAEIMNVVRGDLKLSYDEIKNLNIFQLYVDFARSQNTKSYEEITLLKTTYGMDWSQLPNINYTDSVIDKILRNPELDYFKDFDMGDVVDAMS